MRTRPCTCLNRAGTPSTSSVRMSNPGLNVRSSRSIWSTFPKRTRMSRSSRNSTPGSIPTSPRIHSMSAFGQLRPTDWWVASHPFRNSTVATDANATAAIPPTPIAEMVSPPKRRRPARPPSVRGYSRAARVISPPASTMTEARWTRVQESVKRGATSDAYPTIGPGQSAAAKWTGMFDTTAICIPTRTRNTKATNRRLRNATVSTATTLDHNKSVGNASNNTNAATERGSNRCPTDVSSISNTQPMPCTTANVHTTTNHTDVVRASTRAATSATFEMGFAPKTSATCVRWSSARR